MPEDNRLRLGVDVDVADALKNLEKVEHGFQAVGAKAVEVRKKLGDDGETYKPTGMVAYYESVENGIKKAKKAVIEYNAEQNKFADKPNSIIEKTTASITKQEQELKRLTAQYASLTREQKKMPSNFNSYLGGLYKVGYDRNTYSTDTAAKARDLYASESNTLANSLYKDITNLREKELALIKQINKASEENRVVLREQHELLKAQIDDKERYLAALGKQNIADDNVWARMRAEERLRYERLRSNQTSSQPADVLSFRLLNSQYGTIGQIANSEGRIVKLLDDQYKMRMRNTVAAEALNKELTKEATHINNGTALGKFTNSAIYSMSGYTQYLMFDAFTQGIQGVKDYESGIVDLRRTLQNVTENELRDFGQQAIEYAKQFGISIKEVQDSMTELARAGIDDADVLKQMTEVVAVGLNTTEIETAADMTGYLISTVKQLGMDMSDSMEIIDTWNYLSDNYAVHTDDFALAIQRAGSASKNLGLDLYDVNAMVTILGEATQASGQNIGTALRSMEVRLLRPDTIKTLEKYGIAVKKNEKEFLSFQEIMNNVNEVIKDMDENSVDLNNIMDALGGSWRKNWVTTLANDWERFDSLVQEQQDNMGYSLAENEKAMDTLDKKIIQLHQSMMAFFITSFNESGLTENLKNLADLGVEAFERLTETNIGPLVAQLAQAGAVLLAMKGSAIALNKVFATDLPTSVSQVLKMLSDTTGMGALGAVGAAVNRQDVGNALFERLKAGGVNGQQYNLQEQLYIAQQIDKQFHTSNQTLAASLAEVEKLEGSLATAKRLLAEFDATPDGNKDMTKRPELVRQQVDAEVALANAQERSKVITESNTRASVANREIRAQLTATNLKLIASQVALNAAISIGLSVLAAVAFKAYDTIANAQKNLIEAGKTASDEYASMVSKFDSNKSTLEELDSRYRELSNGVGEHGENVSLTADEYEEYLGILNQVSAITPEITDKYGKQSDALLDKNELIAESIELLKEQERVEKRRLLNEEGGTRIKAALASSNEFAGNSFTDNEVREAHAQGIITQDELDAYFEFKGTGAGDATQISEINKRLRDNMQHIRDDFNAAISDAYKVLEDTASTVEGYEDLAANQKSFISSMAKSYSSSELEDTPKLIRDEMEQITQALIGNKSAQTLIDDIIDADKTEMTMDEYEELIVDRANRIREALDFEGMGIDLSDSELYHILDVGDDLENIETMRNELDGLLNMSEERKVELVDNNSMSALYELYEVLNSHPNLSSFDDLKSKVKGATDETGKLNTSLLRALKTLDSHDFMMFESISDYYKEITGMDLAGDMYDEVADITDALSFSDLDSSNIMSYLDDVSAALTDVFDMSMVEKAIDDIYESTEALNDFLELRDGLSDMDKTSKQYYDTMLKLAMEYPEYIAGVDAATGAVILEDGALQKIQETMEADIIQKARDADAILNLKLVLVDYASSILVAARGVFESAQTVSGGVRNLIGNTLNDISTLVSAIPELSSFVSGLANKISNSKTTFSSAAIGKIDGLLAQLDKFKTETLAPYEKLIQVASTPYRGSNFSGSSKSKSGSGSKSTKDEYTAKADEYHKYTQKLEDIRALLEENSIMEDLMTDSIEDQIKLLSERNGLLEMEAKAVERLMNAKKKELNDTVWQLNQLGYGVKWDRDANTLLIENYKKLESVTGDAAKKQEEMLKNVVKLNDEVREYSLAIKENTAAIHQNNYALEEQKWKEDIERRKKAYEDQIDLLEKQQDAMETLVDLGVEMLKKQYEAEKDEIEDVVDAYKKLIDAKKKALDDSAAEEDYELELARKQKEVAELENKIKEISNDNSASAVAQRLTLQEQLAEKQEELRIFQRDRNIEVAKDALDKEYEDFENTQNSKLDLIEDTLDKEGELREQVMKEIAARNSDFYNKLIQYNNAYGNGVESTVTRAWEYAGQAVEQFGINSSNTLEIITEIADEMERVKAAASALSDEKFVYNPKETYGTTDAKNNAGAALSEKGRQQLNQQKYLHNLMVEAKAENKTGLIAWIKQNRKEWGLDPETGAIIEQFHTGGFVGDKPLLQSNERFAKLLDGEFVVTPQKMDSFIKSILPSIVENASNSGVELNGPLINVEGNVDQTTIPNIQEAGNAAIERLNDYMSKSGITRGARKTMV